jgi:hypothetical protein
MPIKELHTEHLQDSKSQKAGLRFQQLLDELRKRDLSEPTLEFVNKLIDRLNEGSFSDKEWRKLLSRKQPKLITMLEKKEKLVPKNHYQTQWMAIGMAVFGIPIGTALGVATKNMGLLGAGIPIGLALGLAVGASMDKKVAREGRQLDF